MLKTTQENKPSMGLYILQKDIAVNMPISNYSLK